MKPEGGEDVKPISMGAAALVASATAKLKKGRGGGASAKKKKEEQPRLIIPMDRVRDKQKGKAYELPSAPEDEIDYHWGLFQVSCHVAQSSSLLVTAAAVHV